jgi:hypothetical protein
MRLAIVYANQRNHEYATLEHLSLALLDDPDASSDGLQGGSCLAKTKASGLHRP